MDLKKTDLKKSVDLTPQDLALLGDGDLGYIREIAVNEAQRLLGSQTSVSPKSKLFCLYNADGTPVSISGSREAALGSAFEHELMAMSVH
ncbi:MAG: DUF1150 family protein [Aestuariivirga sp.]|uniref:DUF1150 family protein n=1 Tax=Aestuariivirga sp. TaxID=2650926 RepID=UPI0025B98040|nr:DUF1150 family protein [Aestuariivirga sp.]MCA3559585.1 DUF1150 family protein [Aestuariivirga sp.]